MIQKATENRAKRRSGEGGFTLVELLLVIVILGVLAGIVVFAVGGINDNSKKSACAANTKTVETAVEAFYAQNNAYPDSVKALVNAKFIRSAPDDIEVKSDGSVIASC